jgi:hypothetical protein
VLFHADGRQSWQETQAHRQLPQGGTSSQTDRSQGKASIKKDVAMLMTIALILFVLWLLGVVVFKVSAAVIHVLLIAAIVIGLVHLFRGRRV